MPMAVTKARSSRVASREVMRGLTVEIVKRSDAVKGFMVLPKRWIVERYDRMAQPLPPVGEEFGVSGPKSPRIPPSRVDKTTLRKLSRAMQ